MHFQLTGLVHSDAQLAAWLDAGALGGGVELVAWNARLTDDGARAVAEHADASTLAEVDLSWNQIGPAGAEALATLPCLDRLRLYHNEVGAAGAAAIVERAPGLTSLNLCGNRLGDAGARPLVALTTMRELALGWNELTDDTALALATAALPALESLNCRANRLGPAGVAALLSGGLSALRRLGVDENPLGDDGLAAMLAAPGFGQLEWLNLGGTGLDERVVERFAALDACGLRELRVHDNDLPDGTIAALRALPVLATCEVYA